MVRHRGAHCERRDFSNLGVHLGAIRVNYQVTNQGTTSAQRPEGSPQFCTTHWSVVLAAGHSSVPGAQMALETLCRAYWYPLYVYIRRQGQSPHDAQDLTQEFLIAVLTA